MQERNIATLFLIFGVIAPTIAFSDESTAQPPKTRGACKQIVEACISAGFVKGNAKSGSGLWADCVDPIIHGTAQPSNADKPLPSISPELIAACKRRHPPHPANQE